MTTSLPISPPRDATQPHRLLDHAPHSLAELADWFGVLTFEQLDAVWLASIIAIIAEEQDRRLTVPDLQAALATVRARYRNPAAPPRPGIIEAPLAGSAPLLCGLAPDKRTRRRGPVPRVIPEAIARLVEALPRAGASVLLRDICELGPTFAGVRRWAEARPEWCRLDRSKQGHDRNGGSAPIRITRLSDDQPAGFHKEKQEHCR